MGGKSRHMQRDLRGEIVRERETGFYLEITPKQLISNEISNGSFRPRAIRHD
jgi:hypothetical protein